MILRPLTRILVKIPKPSAKQGDVSAAFRAKEFGRNFYDSGGKMFCKLQNIFISMIYERQCLHHTAKIIQIYPPHHHHKAEVNRTQKIALNAAQSPHFYGNFAAISPHNLTIFAALCRTIRLFEQVRHRIICDFLPHLNVASELQLVNENAACDL